MPDSSEDESRRNNIHLKIGCKMKFSGTIGMSRTCVRASITIWDAAKNGLRLRSDSVRSPLDAANQVRLA